MENRPRIGLTLGDPAGVGPEIVARLLAEEAGAAAEALLFAHRALLERGAALAGVALPGDLAVEEPGDPPVTWPTPGEPSEEGGRLALAYLDGAIAAAREGRVAAMVTAPLSKQTVARHAPGFVGHTEYLAAACGRLDEVGMLLQVDELRALHVTTHCALRAALDALTVPAVLAKIRQAWRVAGELALPVRRVGVMGLNPHAGEGGMFGDEEREIVAPAVARARSEGIDAVGPLPPDTAFVRARRGEFGVVVALYHDQGHIPLKLAGWDRGVNITVGLPFPRTSPDHGTAWDLAGRGLADAGSLKEAWRAARRLAGWPPAG